MSFTTLEYDGEEKTLVAWGIALEGCILTLSAMAPDTFRVMVPMAKCTDPAIWPFEGTVIIRTARASATGATNSFSAGLIEFTGKRLLHVVDGRPDFEGVYYNFAGPWYDIANTPYQQMSAWWLGPADQTIEDLSSDVLLMFKLVDGQYSRVTSKVQIFDTLQHVLEQYDDQGMDAPFQVDIDDIDVNAPLLTYPLQDVKCSEVIEYCLRPNPDARLWFDYTTSPPTAHVTSLANCTATTIAIADGVNHESLNIIAREDLVARAVVLFFKQTNQIDNYSWMQKTKQKYGPNGLDSASDPDGGLRVLVQTMDLIGFSQTNVYGSLDVLAVSNALAFWQVVIPELASTQVREWATIGSMSVLDDNGNAVSLSTYPNALLDGSSICPWMVLPNSTPVIGQRVTITADVTYKVYDVEATGGNRSATNGNLLESFPKKRLTWRGTLTNGVTGNYSATAQAVEAEAVPTGLAQNIYQSLSILQYEGQVATVSSDISGGVGMGNKLNLSNGLAAWATMNAQIQGIVKDFGAGRTTITIGPPPHLSAGDLTQLFLINRLRRVYTNPATRVTASTPTASITLGQNAARENTNAGLAQKQFLRMLFTQEA